MKFTVRRGVAIGGLAAAASMGMLINGADAHHPEVSASSTCADGLASVRIDSTSWFTDNNDHRHNANISISFDGAVIGSGSYVPSNNYSFTLLYARPADGATHTVRATAVAGFGPSGEYGAIGEYREATVTLPVNCTSTAPTTTVAPATTVAPVTTTTVPVTTTAPRVGGTGQPGGTGGTGGTGGAGNGATSTTTTVPVVVAGVVENRPAAAVPVAVSPRFAG